MKYLFRNLAFAIMTLFALGANADNTLALQNATVVRGNEAVLYIDMTNTDNILALAFDLTLPDGITIAKNSDGYCVDFVSDRKPAAGVIISGDPIGNTYTIAEYSNSNGTFKGNSGAIFSIKLDISSSVPVGTSTIKMTNAAVVKDDKSELAVPDCSATLTLKEIAGSKFIAELNNVGSSSAYDIAASGGSERAHATAYFTFRTRILYSDGSYEDSKATNTSLNITGDFVTANSLGTTLCDRHIVGYSTPAGVLPYDDENGNPITVVGDETPIYQEANAITGYDDVQLSFQNVEGDVVVPVGGEFELTNIIQFSQQAFFTSGDKEAIEADKQLFFNVIKSPEGFNPLAISQDKAVISVQSTASTDFAQDFTVRVLAIGEQGKMAAADIVFDSEYPANVQAQQRARENGGIISDLHGRIMPVDKDKLKRGIYVIGDKKVLK